LYHGSQILVWTKLINIIQIFENKKSPASARLL